MFAPEGYGIIGIAVVISAFVAAFSFLLPGAWKIAPIVLAVAIVAFTLYFFRDPDRTPPSQALDGKVILAPADGKVVLVDLIDTEPLYLRGPAKQVSIFLSPLNVHVNRSPASGVVEFDRYVAGDYLVAWHPKASEKNERSQLGLRTEDGLKILFKQIAGKVARRIVYHVQVGDTLTAGERFGIVKFGSRMDVLMPPSVEVTVKPGDRVRAGETTIALVPVSKESTSIEPDDGTILLRADGE
ncbi:MAG: phosphatidylserine decarboxylase family protein [Rhodothermales bacterium]|nr:phosphatidylserine decarboxylase family protein [Rhodothermales bacterium]